MTAQQRSLLRRIFKRRHGVSPPRRRRNRVLLSESLEQRQMLAADTAGDDLNSAQLVELTPFVMTEIDATIGDGNHNSADVDLYKVQLAAGQYITIDVDAHYTDDGVAGLYGSYLRVFDSSGTEIDSNEYGYGANDYQGGNWYDSYLAFTAPADGFYYLGISSSYNQYYDPTVAGSGFPDSTGSYKLQLLTNTSAQPSLSIESVSLDEASGPATVTVTLSEAASGTVTVDYTTAAGTATTQDFIPTAGTLTFPAGQTQQTISVSLVDDTEFETDETFTVILSNLSGATTSNPTGQVTITDLTDWGDHHFHDLPGDVLGEAHPLLPQVDTLLEYDGVIGDNQYQSADVDLFKVHLQAGQNLKVDVDAYYLDDGSGPQLFDNYLRIFDDTGLQLQSNAYGDAANDYLTGNLYDGYLSFTAVETGDYYIGLSSEGNRTYDPTVAGSGSLATAGVYRLQLLAGAPPAAPDPAPRVESVVLNGGQDGRSMLTEVVVTFDSEVTIDDSVHDPFRFINRDSGAAVVDNATVSTVDGKTVVTFAFLDPASSISRGSLPSSLLDGNYQLTIDASTVSGNGRLLDGDGDGNGGDDFVFGDVIEDHFYRWFGDVNVGTSAWGDGERSLDSTDQSTFQSALGRQTGDPLYVAELDHNGDGIMDAVDQAAFDSRLAMTLTFDGPNHQPATTPDNFTLDQDGSLLANVLANDNDADNDTLTVVGFTAPLSGTLAGNVVAADGSFTYTPTPGFHGGDSFTYTVSDGIHTVIETVTLTVTPSTTPQLALPADLTIEEDAGDQVIHFTVSDPDTPLDQLTTSYVSSNPALIAVPSGSVAGTGATRTLTVTPAANQFGTAVITITVDDGSESVSKHLTLSVAPVNDAPSITGAADQTILEDGSVEVMLTISDVETLTDNLTVTFSSSNESLLPAASIVESGSGTQRTITLTPVANAAGQTTITITASDGEQMVSTSLLLSVTAVNDLPILSSIADQTIAEDTTLDALVIDVSDVDHDVALLSWSVASSDPLLVDPANVSLTWSNSQWSLSAMPAANAFGATTLSLTADDGVDSVSQSFELIVTASNDPPVIQDGTVSIDEDGEFVLTSSVLSYSDVEQTALQNVTLVSLPSHGTLYLMQDPLQAGTVISKATLDAGSIVFRPAANEFGSPYSEIVLMPSDGQDVGQPATLAIDVSPINDAPTVTSMADVLLAVGEPSAPLAFTIGDVESDALALSVSATSDNPSLIGDYSLRLAGMGADRTLVISPQVGAMGTATITVSVSDGELTATESFVVTVEQLDPLSEVAWLNLVDDTGVANDNSTFLPAVQGRIRQRGDETGFTVEFDHDQDGNVDGTATVDAGTLRFQYDPLVVDPTFNQTAGPARLDYRLSVARLGQSPLIGDWQTFAFDLEAVPPSPLAVDQVAVEVFQTSAIDYGLLYRGVLTGGDTLGESVASNVFVELDSDGDQVPDASVAVAGLDDGFTYTPASANFAAHDIAFRVKHWDSFFAADRLGVWTSLNFDPSLAPTVTSVGLRADTGLLPDDLVTADPVITGTLATPLLDTAGVAVEMDIDADGVADLTTSADVSGQFAFAPHSFAAGAVNVRVRATAGGEASPWEDFSFVYQPIADPAIASFGLLIDDGELSDDGISSFASLTGTFATKFGAPQVIEIDVDADGAGDVSATATGGLFFVDLPAPAVGQNTLSYRPTRWNPYTEQTEVGGWANFTFDYQPVTTALADFESLGLATDTGVSDSDGITSDPTIIGQVDSHTYAGVKVDLDPNDPDVLTLQTDASGAFEYVPVGLATGTHTVLFSVSTYDLQSRQLVDGPWTPLAFTLEDALSVSPTVSSLALLADTGAAADDGLTENPVVVGQISGSGSLENVTIEIDVDGDGTPDQNAFTDAGGRFQFEPLFLDYGAVTVAARAIEFDLAGAANVAGAWTSLSFTYEDQPDQAPRLSLLVFDVEAVLLGRDPKLRGVASDQHRVAGITVEVDATGDGVADYTTVTDQQGVFEVELVNLDHSTASIDVRGSSVHPLTHQVLTGDWHEILINGPIADPASLTPALVTAIGLSEDTDVPDDLVSADPELTGSVERASYGRVMFVDFDVDGDTVVDGSVIVGADQNWTFTPVG
ncbi:MAG: DVUA0089 family protein, partial [Pirellulales bacterium]|nr:DVUA0089 family protein [Pirellulales bacterium]